ncbi:nuclear transport factor 2 family protein [Luteimonas kalidii]|uniref:Nuclear transport factor 2 family protein n=1 Tax=Luteimonas kalidii TaxID=3042025 RepID=A0ABT6JRX0_9GAMM|nr:nuclear transport factor 2 family protein [Luteimonas kalidii]MDH5833434.1 nuclear transport factor 2 family protein [Luteimonas kalidii]
MSSDPKSVLAAANEAVSRGDHGGFLAHCTDDVVWHFIGDRTIEGKPAVRAYMDETYIQPPEFDVELMIADADHVVAIGRITLIDADGKRSTFDYSDAWRLRDGKLAELRAFVVEADGA